MQQLREQWLARYPDDEHLFRSLGRHIGFGMDGDYSDIIKNDIPELEERADSLLLADSKNQRFGFEELLHPAIMKSSYDLYRNGHLREAVLNSVTALFDTGSSADELPGGRRSAHRTGVLDRESTADAQRARERIRPKRPKGVHADFQGRLSGHPQSQGAQHDPRPDAVKGSSIPASEQPSTSSRSGSNWRCSGPPLSIHR